MMHFSPITGLPSVEHDRPTLGIDVESGSLPDLLEANQAQLQITCDCGASSIHQAACSIHVKGSRPFPAAHRIDMVVCPACGDKVPLMRPLVIHDEPRKRVVLRLPTSYRMRINFILGWWFKWLQNTSRPVVPMYARQPEVEFYSLQRPATPQHQQGRKAPPSSPSLSAVPRAVPSSPSLSAAPALTPAPTPGTTPLGSPKPTPVAPASPKPASKPLSDALSAGLPSLETELKTSPSSETIGLGPKGNAPSANLQIPPKQSETAGFESLGQKSSFGEFPLDEMSGEFDEFEESDDAMPTLMVSVPEPSKPKKKGIGRTTAALSSSPSVVVSPDDLGQLHEEDEEEGTIASVDQSAGLHLGKSLRPNKMKEAAEPAATREAPAPILADLESIKSSAEASMDALLDVLTTKPTEPIPDTPTVARRVVPQSISEIRASQSRATTSVRNIVGNGVSISPEYEQNQPLDPEVLKAWKKSGDSFHYGLSAKTQRCTVRFKLDPAISRQLDQGGELSFSIQLHRMTSYPLVVLLFAFRDGHGEITESFSCPMDVEHHNTLIFLDMLMQDFCLHCHFCEDDYSVYRDIQVQLPLEDNVEYLLDQARSWKQSIPPSTQSFERARKEFDTPGYDRFGKMEHNFNQDSFAELGTPAQAQLASGIVAYWSETEQFDYLITMKSFPINHFTTIQRRTIEGCMSYGLFLPEHLRLLAIELKLIDSQPALLRQLLTSFAETNLAIRQPNDLDPWDNLTNWQKLLDACDEYGVDVDEDIEELAELAQRRCQTDSENTHNVDDEDIMEVDGFQEMDARELVDMLQEPAHRLEASLALCDMQDPEHVDHVAGVFAHLERDDAITLAEAFTQFGHEAEPLLISWLHLPRPYHREAAMLALGTMGSTQAIDEIIKRLRSGEEWETAAEALGRIGEPALDSLSQEIKNKNWLIRLRAVKALQKIHSDRTRTLFEELRSDPNEVVKAEVAAILNA